MNREIPHNIDAEQSVLGAMFLTKKALQKALELLDGSEFYSDNHTKIFECMKNLDARGSIVDITTVSIKVIRTPIRFSNAIGNDTSNCFLLLILSINLPYYKFIFMVLYLPKLLFSFLVFVI